MAEVGVHMNINKTFKTVATGVALTATILFASPSITEAKSFTDLNNLGSHTEAVNYLNSLNAYDYKTGTKLNGEAAVTRTEASKLLYTLYKDKFEKVRTYDNNFKDVSNTTSGYKEIVWAYEVGIFDGDTNKKFNPRQSLTRAQMAKVIVNTFDLESKGNISFKDVSSNHWAYNYVSTLASNGVTNGNGQGSYMPESNVTLSQLSSFIYRIVNDEAKVTPTQPAQPVETKPSTPSTSKYKTFEEFKRLVVDMWNSTEYNPEPVVFYTTTDMTDRYMKEYSLTYDISQDVKEFDYNGQGTTIYVEKISEGVYKNTLGLYNPSEDEQQVLVRKQKLDAAEKYIVANYPLNTEYDVVYAVNDFISKQMEYGVDVDPANPIFPVSRNNSTCTDYTDAASALYARFGIKSRVVTGDRHAWNAVKVGGNWYYSDATYYESGDERYLLMTQTERQEGPYAIKNIETTFRATDVPFDKSMALPYSYQEVKKAQALNK